MTTLLQIVLFVLALPLALGFGWLVFSAAENGKSGDIEKRAQG